MLSRSLRRYYVPLRLPKWPNAISASPYTQQLTACATATMSGLPSCTTNLPLHAIPATPVKFTGRFRYPVPQTLAFPLRPQGQLPQSSNEATYRFACATACSFASYGKLTTPDCSDAASQCYKGIRTTPSAGLKPARSIADNGIRSNLRLTVAQDFNEFFNTQSNALIPSHFILHSP